VAVTTAIPPESDLCQRWAANSARSVPIMGSSTQSRSSSSDRKLNERSRTHGVTA
jgi:hypothetical protein